MSDINKLMSLFKEEDITDIPDYLEPKAKCSYIKKSINRNKHDRNVYLIATLFIPVLLFLFEIYKSDDTFILNEFTTLIYIYSIMFLFYFIIKISKSSDLIREFELNLRDLENEIDLANIDLDSREKRAEKLFKLHQYELDKYYTQNLRQGNQIFKMGLFFFIVGFFIVSGSIYLIAFKVHDNDSSIIIAGLGAVGTILSNFIAAIYIKMFSETAKTSTQFHNRLVTTHNLMFSNFISSKINDNTLRENTYSKIAGNLADFSQSSGDGSGDNTDVSKENE
jgi:hypothetical protein